MAKKADNSISQKEAIALLLQNNIKELKAILRGQVSPWSHQNLIPFMEKSPESSRFKAFK